MRTVLHVLPHPGGGGERYVDLLSRMDGYRFERIYLAPSPSKWAATKALPRSSLKLLQSADLIHVHGEVAAGLCLPVLAARKSVVTFNGLHLLRRATGALRRTAVVNLKLVVRQTYRAICVGESEHADSYAAVGKGLGGRLVTIHNGVDLPALPTPAARAEARAKLGLAPHELTGVFVGELSPHKDPLTAVTAALRAQAEGIPIVLLVAGDGPLRQMLDDVAKTSTGVRLLGHRNDVSTLLTAADFFVLSSLREGLSFALLDAMGLSLPAVVSDAAGNFDATAETGIVVPIGDVNGFADAFGRLSDSEMRGKLGAAARERVEHRFTADGMASATRLVYDEALSWH